MTAIFVSATGTDVGKTFITAALIRHFRARGRAVDAIKPVVSGFDPVRWQDSDPARLLAALGREVTLAEAEHISPWRFAAPLSPDMAAQREARSIDFEAVVEFCRGTVKSGPEHLLVEGIGGIMVPFDRSHTVLDLITALQLPLLLVAGSYVGTISHTLTALQVLARRNVEVAAVVVSESADSAAPLDETVAALGRFSNSIDVIGVPRLIDGGAAHPTIAQIAQLL